MRQLLFEFDRKILSGVLSFVYVGKGKHNLIESRV